jgi:hypothetical protein
MALIFSEVPVSPARKIPNQVVVVAAAMNSAAALGDWAFLV